MRLTSDRDPLVLDSLPPPLVIEDGLDLIDVLGGGTNTGGHQSFHELATGRALSARLCACAFSLFLSLSLFTFLRSSAGSGEHPAA